MGVDLAIILGHSLRPAELLAFPERALASTRMRSAAQQLWQVMRPRWPNLGRVEDFSAFLPCEHLSENDVMATWGRGDAPSFNWAGFHLYFGKRAAAAIHLEKLAGFVLDHDQLRDPLQACARALASELRSPSIVYGPDSSSPFEDVLYVEEGASLPEILANARRTCGVAARSIREMDDEDEDLNPQQGCYYVEAVDLGEG
jgi:hypothetical protein